MISPDINFFNKLLKFIIMGLLSTCFLKNSFEYLVACVRRHTYMCALLIEFKSKFPLSLCKFN